VGDWGLDVVPDGREGKYGKVGAENLCGEQRRQANVFSRFCRISVMPSIPELLNGHVTLEVECLDRLYLNGYIGPLATAGGLVNFMREQLHKPIPSPVVLGQITEKFRDAADSATAWLMRLMMPTLVLCSSKYAATRRPRGIPPSWGGLLRKPNPEQKRPFLFRLKRPFDRPFSDLALGRNRSK
jgi:hypothetical protein